MKQIILPPGSSSTELQTAINNATSGDIIEISSDMGFSGTVTVPSGLAITIQSTAGNNWLLARSVANARHFTVNGALVLENVTLHGVNIGGGIAVNSGGVLTANAGTVIQNCRAAYGGGVFVAGGTFEMYNGAAIRLNAVNSDGGGVLVDEGAFNMHGGLIEYNEAPADGGGVYIYASTFNMYDGAIIAFNTVTGRVSEGGGVMVDAGAFNMHGGLIEQNQASGVNTFGGGVSVIESDFYMYGGEIRNNIAADGGGVSTDDSYFNMSSGFIYGNTAKGGGTVTVIGVGDVGTFGGRGGGVMDNFFSIFEMTGGEIRANHNEPGVNTSGLNGFNGPSKGGGVYVYYGSSLNLAGVAIITNNTADRGGGIAAVGTSVSSNSLTMSGNAAVSGNHAQYGGGLCFLVGHTSYTTYGGSNSLTMSGSAAISGNDAAANGGGLYMYSVNVTAPNTTNSLIMSGQAAISANTAGQDGGGLYMNMVTYGNASNILALNESAAIANNIAFDSGGGVYIDGVATPVSSVTLNDNTAVTANHAGSGHGGGIYVAALAFLEVTEAGFITDNSAPNGNGGGINTSDTTYTNLRTASETVFSGNTAVAAYAPPADAAVLYPNIQFASTSITTHPLNNYDINFTSGEPLVFYNVSYQANDGTGSHIDTNIPGGAAYTVLSPQEAGISRPDYSFTGWNSEANGSGTLYVPGEVIILSSNLILYAQWAAHIPCCTCLKSCCMSCNKPCINQVATYWVINQGDAALVRSGKGNATKDRPVANAICPTQPYLEVNK